MSIKRFVHIPNHNWSIAHRVSLSLSLHFKFNPLLLQGSFVTKPKICGSTHNLNSHIPLSHSLSSPIKFCKITPNALLLSLSLSLSQNTNPKALSLSLSLFGYRESGGKIWVLSDLIGLLCVKLFFSLCVRFC